MISLPRLFVDGKFQRFVNPVSLMITQNLVPLSTASITLPIGEELPIRSWVELFTPYGSAGMFRVRSPHDTYGQDTSTAELEHMISEVGDYIVKEEISEMMAADTAMKRAFKHYGGGKWKLGSVTALGSGLIAFEAKYERVLDTMLAILEQKKDCMMSFDFSTFPWTINIVKKGTSVSAEGRLARNVTSATISCDDSELCTRVWYQVFDKSKKATWKNKDASTVSKYGIVEGTVRTSSDMTSDEITATVNAYIADHKEPRVSISIQGVELCQTTGESLDKVTVGKLYRLALPDYGITATENITSIVWNDVYGNPTSVTVNLGAEEDTVVTFLHNLDAKGSGGGGGGKAKELDLIAWSQYKSDWDVQNDHIAGMVLEQDKQGKILNQAGLTLNSKGLLVYAKGEGTIRSNFDVLKEKISIVVTDDNKVDSAEIVAGINSQTGSYVKIKAKTINLTGYVTMSDLKATNAEISNLKSGATTASTLKTYLLSASTGFVYQGHNVVYKTITIDGTTYHLMGY